MIIDKD